METAALRDKLHSLIETSSEEQLEEIYDFLKQNEYTDDFKKSLDHEFEQYQQDGEAISRMEIDKMIEQLLHQ